MELGQLAHLRARPHRDRESLPGQEPLLLHGRAGRHPGGRHHLRLREHADEDEGRRRGPGGGPQVHRERRPDGGGVRQRQQDHHREVHGAGEDRRGPPPRAHRQQGPAHLLDPLQPRVPRRGHSHEGPRRARPRPHRRPHHHRGLRRGQRPRGRLRELGASRADPHHELVELGVVEAGRERDVGAARQQHQLHLPVVREDRRGRCRGVPGHRQGLEDRAEVLGRLRRLRRLLLPEGHPQPRLHLRVRGAERGGQVLAAGRRHERAPEVDLRQADHLQPLQHRHGEEDRGLRLRLQEGHRRRAGDAGDDRLPHAHAGRGGGPRLRPEGGEGGRVDRVPLPRVAGRREQARVQRLAEGCG
mmetsp:Transcript_28167/g.80002  ORF Transcript_28167/g.80002 Transcript_28167/m.80002 type:complete len:358 (-) Transcript_28167:1375-2448(-)